MDRNRTSDALRASEPAFKRRARLYSWIALGFLMVWLLLPIFWAFMSTFKTSVEIYRIPVRILPESFSFSNYTRVLTDPDFPRYFGNTVFLTAITTALTLSVSIWAAYAFARMHFPFQHILLLFVLVPRLIPRISVVIPLYRIIVSLGLLNTYTALILTYTVTSIPFAVWILTNVFQSIPREIEESAFIDGAKLRQTMARIMIPVAAPGVLTVIIFTVRETWNEFPFVLSFTTSSELRTLPYQLFLFRDTLGIENWPLINTFAIITVIPILVAYFIFAKQVTTGIVQGAVK
ncbi:MAG: carbohydrate ABC transporter permease [Spirochaetales bacterium]|nr:carbohydrate ABC transporter permease [Spirochaetales bacterium]